MIKEMETNQNQRIIQKIVLLYFFEKNKKFKIKKYPRISANQFLKKTRGKKFA